MYAVTGSAREYEEKHLTSTGAVRLYLIEECAVENEGGGWRLFWYNDGSTGGCVLAQMWGWYGEYDIPQPLEGSEEDIFDEAELETLREHEEEIVPAPFGVRYRTLTEAEFEGLEWEDLANCQKLGRRDYWQEWEQRLCA
jgi:hypothetical protein